MYCNIMDHMPWSFRIFKIVSEHHIDFRLTDLENGIFKVTEIGRKAKNNMDSKNQFKIAQCPLYHGKNPQAASLV